MVGLFSIQLCTTNISTDTCFRRQYRGSRRTMASTDNHHADTSDHDFYLPGLPAT